MATSESFLLEQASYENTPTFTLRGLRCRARVLQVDDSETLWLAIKYPANNVLKYQVRLRGVRSDNDPLSKTFLERLISKTPYVDVEVFDIDSYGCPFVTLMIPGDFQSVNDRMVEMQSALNPRKMFSL